nr:hypothetical protein [Tanacetum cinerariifolium]
MMNLTTLPLSFWDYALEAIARILNMVSTKKVDKTPYELWFGKVPNLSYLKVWGYTSPSKITSEIPMEVEGFKPPQEEEAPIYRSEWPHQAPDSLCLNVEVEEHSLGDLNEPANYKAAILQSVKTYLGKCFAMKDLGEAAFILVIKIYRDRSRRLIGLCQSAYMDKILKRCRMDYSKRGYIPMQERLDLNKTQGASTLGEVKRMQNVPYALAVGSIMLEISKKSTTAMSATEAEYIAASEAGMEAVWIRKFISGIGIVPTINEPIRMFCDNSATLHFTNEPGVQKGARHFHRKYHYVCECIKLGEIKFLKVHTDDNLADPFAKTLSNKKLTQHTKSMGLRLASSFL